MKKMILHRTVSRDRTSYGGFQWGGVGEWNVAPDWDPDPEIYCGKGLHGIAWDTEGQDVLLLNMIPGNILQIVEAHNCVLSKSGNKYRFEKGIVKEEIFITEEVLSNLFNELKNEKWIYFAGRYWEGVTDEQRMRKFEELKDEKFICLTGIYWKGVTDEQRRRKFDELKDEKWIYWAGEDWKGVTDEQRRRKFDELKDEKCIYWAGRYWKGVTDEQRRRKFDELKDEKCIYWAGEDWKGITYEQRIRKFKELKI